MPSGHRPPIPPTYARVAFSGTTQTHKFANVFYLGLTGGGIVSSDLNTLATSLATQWNTNIAPALCNTVTLTNTDIVYIPSVGNELVGASSASHNGQVVNAPVDDVSASFVVNWLISAYYRGGHPRWYLPGVDRTAVTNGSAIAGANTSALATDMAAFRTAVNAMTTTNISAVVIGTMSFQSGNAWRGTPLFRPFTGVKIKSTLGSQRRRIHS